MTDSSSRRSPPLIFRSKLRPLTILDLERMSPAQLQRCEAEEELERRDWLDAQRRKPALGDEGAKSVSAISAALNTTKGKGIGAVWRARRNGDPRFAPRPFETEGWVFKPLRARQ